MSDKQILSHLPGTFYRKPSPENPPFKEVGDKVEPADTVGLVEVMKSFHEIKAGSAGTFVQFLIDNEGQVTAGQPVAVLKV